MMDYLKLIIAICHLCFFFVCFISILPFDMELLQFLFRLDFIFIYLFEIYNLKCFYTLFQHTSILNHIKYLKIILYFL